MIGLFANAGEHGLALARLAASGLEERVPAPLSAAPVESAFGEPQELEDGARAGGVRRPPAASDHVVRHNSRLQHEHDTDK